MSDETLLCQDCVHSFRNWIEYLTISKKHSLKCRLAYREAEIKIDPVIGPQKIEAYYERCSFERITDSRRNTCGQSAQFWQPKHKSGLFKLIKKEHHE